jgi:hypothetical protein
VKVVRERVMVRLPLGRIQIDLDPLPRLVGMHNDVANDRLLGNEEGAPLFRLRVDGEPIPAENFELDTSMTRRFKEVAYVQLRYVCREPVLVSFELTLVPSRGSELEFRSVALINNDDKAHRLAVEGPFVGPVQLGEKAENVYYLFPRAGACLSNRQTYRRDRFGGRFPVQFMTAFNPVVNSGVYLRTRGGVEMRDYALGKDEDGVKFEVYYPADVSVEPGKSLALPRTWLGISEGDWHRAFTMYRRSTAEALHVTSDTEPWFMETFNFRQRFLHSHDPMYDEATGEYRLTEAVEEDKAAFGGIDYLHIFDWGNVPGIGRVYGRTGDDSPFDDTLKGGMPALRKAISEVQRRDTRVGLYIEGYLLQQKSTLGQAHGADWQIMQRNGKPMFWPGSTEMMICPAVKDWREVQASTYERMVRELRVDGMYMDQFGFANPAKDCWSSEHGHDVPSCTVASENAFAETVRKRMDLVNTKTALYSEEIPCDVNSVHQDGSFSYHMRNCRWTRPMVPLNVPRFSYPWFKTFEILVCDQPTSGWTEGVKWTFFNGEGIWLEGQPDTWFRPETLATIRTCYSILHEHRKVFASPAVDPLIDTGVPGIYANRFHMGRKTIYTLYNARHRTFRGTIQGPRWGQVLVARDLWNGRIVTPEKDGMLSRLAVEIEPRGVGCLLLVR